MSSDKKYISVVNEAIKQRSIAGILEFSPKYQLGVDDEIRQLVDATTPYRVYARNALKSALCKGEPTTDELSSYNVEIVLDARELDEVFGLIRMTQRQHEEYVKMHHMEYQEQEIISKSDSFIIPNTILGQEGEAEPMIYHHILDAERFIELTETNIYHNQRKFGGEMEGGASPYYSDRVIFLCSAFRYQGNGVFRVQCLLGYFPPQILSKVDAQFVEPRFLHEKRAKANEAILASKDLGRFIIETGIECKKCKRQTVTRQEKQSRSADEATTLYYKCSACGFTWSIN